MSCLNPGEEVITFEPFYANYNGFAATAGVKIVPVRSFIENDFALPPISEIEKMITPKTKAILICNPNNPTGALYSKEELIQLRDIVKKHDLFLFSDEVYRFLEYDPADRLPAACELYEKGISLGVMSKAFGLAGLRLGWVACRDRRILRAMAAMKDYTTICAAAPSEFLAGVALRRREAVLGRCLGTVRANLGLLDRFLARHSDRFSWVRPKAGPVAFPALRSAAASDDFCSRLLREQGVLLAPGRLFQAGPAHFRIGFGRADFAEGLSEFDLFLEGKNPG